MLSVIKKLHKKIPAGVRKLYMPFVYDASDRIQRRFQNHIQKINDYICPSVFVFEGLEKNSNSPLTFACIGAGFNKQLEHYWAQMAFGENYHKQDIGRHFIWDIFSILRKLPFKCDFLLVDGHFLKMVSCCQFSGFKMPNWTSFKIDISAPIEELLGSQRPYIQRKIRKNKLSYGVVKDNASFDDFYYKMFLPYISTRHALKADLTSYQELLEMFKRGGLILIKKEENIVAGALFEFIGRDVKLRRFGISEGKQEYVQDGALGAAYYFSAVEMKKLGYANLYIGGTRPFINDGVFRHKMTLDAYLVKDNGACSWLGLLNNSAGLKHFLTNNPFIFLDENRDHYGAVFGEYGDKKFSPECEDLIKLSCEALDRTFLYTFNNLSNDLERSFLKEYTFTVKPVEEMIIK